MIHRFHNNSAGGMYKPSSYSGSGAYGDGYDDDRHRSKEEDRSGYGSGREREWGYRDEDQYSPDGDRYGRDYEERNSKDGYRDDEYRGRKSVDDHQYGSRSRASDRDHDHSFDDDGQHSSRGSGAKTEDHSLEGRLERKLSEQNTGAPLSNEEAVSQSPLHNQMDGEISVTSVPRGSSPASDKPHQIFAPNGSSFVSDNPTEATAAASTAASGNRQVEAFDEFDPRGPVSATPAPANNAEVDLFGSLSESFSSNALALVPSSSETSTSQGNANLDSTVSFAPPPASHNSIPVFEDPFGDSPFKAIASTESAPSQLQTHQSLTPSQSSGPNTESVSNFGFGDSFSAVPYPKSGASDTQHLSSNSHFLPQDLSTSSQETDILADILPPATLPGTTSQQTFSASPDAHSSSSFSASSGQMAFESYFVQPAQFMQQGYSDTTSQPAAQTFSAPVGQLVQPPLSVSQHSQKPFPTHADQSVFGSARSGGHMYGGFHSQAVSLTQGASSMFPQSQSGHNGSMNTTNEQGSTTSIPSHTAPQALPSANYLASHSPIDQASQFNSGNFIAQPGNSPPFTQQPFGVPGGKQSDYGSLLSHGVNAPNTSQPTVSQPSKDKFETKSTVWTDTLSKGLVNLNISGPKINPLADIGIDFDAINRKEKRMEKPATTTVTSTVTMGKAMGSGSGIGRAGAGALRTPSNLMMGPGVGMGMGKGPSYGGMSMVMGPSYGGMTLGMGMNMGMGMGQMQPPAGLPPGSNIPGNYNSMMGTGGTGHPQQPYYGGIGGYR